MDRFKIIAVTDAGICAENIFDRVEKLSSLSGIDGIILRARELDGSAYEAAAYEAVKRCKKTGNAGKLIMHYHYSLSVRLGLGVQLPMDILSKITCTKDSSFIGASVHSADEAKYAEDLGAAYAVFGHIFDTACKPGLMPRGPDRLTGIVNSVRIPVYAIGGINPGNIRDVRDAGAAGACIMSGFMKCEDPEAYTEELMNALKE